MYEEYYRLCKECEYLYHCFAREQAEKIRKNNTEDMYLRPDVCINFYPERKE